MHDKIILDESFSFYHLLVLEDKQETNLCTSSKKIFYTKKSGEAKFYLLE